VFSSSSSSPTLSPGPLPSSFISGLYRSIPQVHQAIPAILRTRRIFPLPQSLSLFSFSSLIPPQSLYFLLSFLIMTSLVVSSSSASSLHSASPLSFHTASSPPSPKPLATSSASSSQVSFSQADEGQFAPPKGLPRMNHKPADLPQRISQSQPFVHCQAMEMRRTMSELVPRRVLV
jgi:hypothetical protein